MNVNSAVICGTGERKVERCINRCSSETQSQQDIYRYIKDCQCLMQYKMYQLKETVKKLNIPFLCVFVLFRPPRDYTMPTSIGDSCLLYSVY